MFFSVLTRSLLALLLILSGVSVPASADRLDEKTISEERKALQAWVMRYAVIGSRFDLQGYKNRLGPSQTLKVTNRNHEVVGYYFPLAHVTLFENTTRNRLVLWRPGRVDTL